jgi:hypothetical protein
MIDVFKMTWRQKRTFVLERDNYICQYCGIGVDGLNPLHIDHLIPRRKGGTDELDNLVACCQKCNCKKATKTLKIEKYNEILEIIKIKNKIMLKDGFKINKYPSTDKYGSVRKTFNIRVDQYMLLKDILDNSDGFYYGPIIIAALDEYFENHNIINKYRETNFKRMEEIRKQFKSESGTIADILNKDALTWEELGRTF